MFASYLWKKISVSYIEHFYNYNKNTNNQT